MKYMHPRYPRITIDSDVCLGKLCIRGIRFPVTSLLDYLSSGISYEELLNEFSFLERKILLKHYHFHRRCFTQFFGFRRFD